jgi:hypothetical protein
VKFHLDSNWLTMATDPHQRKRQRYARPSADDILRKGRFIMHDDPFKESAPATEDRHFRALFGCPVDVALHLWLMLVDHDLVPSGATMKHFLWALLFLKVYPTDLPMCRMTKADPKTTRKWVDIILDSIACLEPIVVSCLLSPFLWYHSCMHTS